MDEIHSRLVASGICVEQLPALPIQILRLRDPAPATLSAIATAFGMPELPTEPNRTAGDMPRIARLAPGEWMIVGGNWGTDVLRAICGHAAHHLADVSDGRIRFAISGERARDLLAKGCTLDLHPRTFGVNRCAQTVLAQVRVLIDQISEEPAFHLHADASYCAHLQSWFQDAVVEFNFTGNR